MIAGTKMETANREHCAGTHSSQQVSLHARGVSPYARWWAQAALQSGSRTCQYRARTFQRC